MNVDVLLLAKYSLDAINMFHLKHQCLRYRIHKVKKNRGELIHMNNKAKKQPSKIKGQRK